LQYNKLTRYHFNNSTPFQKTKSFYVFYLVVRIKRFLFALQEKE